MLLPVLTLAFSVVPVHAAVNNPAATAKVSFTFDDGLTSAVTQAAPTLQKYGLSGTDYIITGCVGMTTAPNTCPANGDATYMTWDQITQLQNTYGWEVGAHTVNHPQLATDGLTQAQVAAQMTGAKQALAAHGFNATDFATPYGDYNNMVLAEIAKVYASHRGFFDVDPNIWPYNDTLLNDMQVQEGVTVAQVEARIDQAIANKQWLVLTMHDIKVTPSTNPADYEYATAKLDQIAAYVKAKQDAGLVKGVTIDKGLVTSDTNMFANGGFDNGISGGWTTDTPTSVVADSANNGSYPSSTKSVSITAAATGNVHLFSPKVAVDSTQTYMLKNFVNVTARTTGEFGYYIDEYNAAGAWVSGKWVKAIAAPTVQSSNFTYTPSSTAVKKASLQVYVTGGSGIKAYVDQFQMFSLTGTTTPPPAPTTVNLLPNSTFDNGIADGWTTDKATSYVADAANHGSATDPVKSIKLSATTVNAHLFAPRVTVKSTSSYNVNAFLNLTALTGNEVGFYIDEYDASGVWVSGQYAFAQRAAGSNNLTFPYTPTMASVTQARLQVILGANSGAAGYLDTVQFMAPAGEIPTPPAPTPTNLMTNGTFDAGITGGWTTNDATNIKADNANHGGPNNPVNSVSLTGSSVVRHLFSPKVAVTSTKSYSVTSYLDVQQIT
ncbi:MAG TPA: polysaccharide deacetylase family protein, partial [Candidatus Saccharimonadales bacterium]|nr:polysaccharide deacetylase family protein [Candidatus Saccharimonadales bacterium]